jgi:hypothetical protein
MSELRGMKDLFAGRHFDRDVIILVCVGTYVTSSAFVIWLR